MPHRVWIWPGNQIHTLSAAASDSEAPPFFSDVQLESKYSKDLRAKRQRGDSVIYTDNCL